MKKAAILTITDGVNYGNKLQNYAVSKMLENLGCKPCTILIGYKKHNDSFKKKIIEVLSYVKHFYGRRNYYKYYKKQVIGFNRFVKKYIPGRKYKSNDNLSLEGYMNDEYDYFVCGSDQIWNPYLHTTNSLMFAQGASDFKKIALSASFGVNKIPDDRECEYAQYLKTFKNISVREDIGEIIVKDLCGRDAEVLVDPTMMLTKDEWTKIERKPACYRNKPYILTYMLGGQAENTGVLIQSLSKENNLEVITLFDAKYCEKNKMQYFAAAPDEFIWLIRNAEIIITDSFHACVFSIIMERPFVVCDRNDNSQSMSSRIDTLLKKFNLESRHQDKINYNSVFNIDYTGSNAIFDKERKKALNYLKKSFDL